jgi:hypothetical protein
MFFCSFVLLFLGSAVLGSWFCGSAVPRFCGSAVLRFRTPACAHLCYNLFMDIRSVFTPSRALLIAVASVIILAIVWWPGADGHFWTNWSKTAPSNSGINGNARPEPTLAPGTLRTDFDTSLYPDQRDPLQSELEQALTYTIGRFGSVPNAPLTAAFDGSNGCVLSGIAYTDIRRMIVSTCNDVPRQRAVAIMAHEYVHQLAQDRYGPPHLAADLILAEGVATWGAGRYWLSGHTSFRSFVQEQRRNGNTLPLATHYAGRGADAMNTLYYQWASFVEFLIETYGREAFDLAYISGASSPGSADYKTAFGKELTTLEREWEIWVDQ